MRGVCAEKNTCPKSGDECYVDHFIERRGAYYCKIFKKDATVVGVDESSGINPKRILENAFPGFGGNSENSM